MERLAGQYPDVPTDVRNFNQTAVARWRHGSRSAWWCHADVCLSCCITEKGKL